MGQTHVRVSGVHLDTSAFLPLWCGPMSLTQTYRWVLIKVSAELGSWPHGSVAKALDTQHEDLSSYPPGPM